MAITTMNLRPTAAVLNEVNARKLEKLRVAQLSGGRSLKMEGVWVLHLLARPTLLPANSGSNGATLPECVSALGILVEWDKEAKAPKPAGPDGYFRPRFKAENDPAKPLQQEAFRFLKEKAVAPKTDAGEPDSDIWFLGGIALLPGRESGVYAYLPLDDAGAGGLNWGPRVAVDPGPGRWTADKAKAASQKWGTVKIEDL